MQLASKNLLVVGLGKSGQAVAKRALSLGAEVWVYEEKHSVDEVARWLGGSVARNNILSSNPATQQPSHLLHSLNVNFDLVVTSPGVPFNHYMLKLAAENKWPVISEIEFAYRLLRPKFVIGVTGTNGKTTVVEMLSNVFESSGAPFTVAGNIGTPLSSLGEIEGTLILELSSFQLHFIDKFKANIGVLLNVEQDHLDWHCCFGQYLRDKLRLFRNQRANDIALLNIDDQVLQNEKLKIENEKSQFKDKKFTRGKIHTFGTGKIGDYRLNGNYLMAGNEKIMQAEDIKLKGMHNISNALAVIACAKEAGIDSKFIKEGIRSFKGLKHRLQFVSQKNGVGFYNDSKSTNPNSTKKAIEAFNKPLILILGGRNKGNDFSFIGDYIGTMIKQLVFFGEAANEIKKQVGAGIMARTVEEALEKAVQEADKGDIVLFSPGCASFDLFQNYAERGEVFIKAVNSL